MPTYRTVEQLVEATPAAELEFLIVCIASSDCAAMLKRVAALGIPALSQCAHASPVSPPFQAGGLPAPETERRCGEQDPAGADG